MDEDEIKGGVGLDDEEPKEDGLGLGEDEADELGLDVDPELVSGSFEE